MSFILPDIDLNSWTDYQRKELDRQLQEKLQGFGLNQMLEEKVAGLQEVVGQINPFDQPEPQPVPESVVQPPPPPEPAPVVTPPPPPPEPVVTPPPAPAPAAIEAQPSGPSPLTSALQAVQQAGGDVGAFIEAFNSGVGDQGARARAALQQVIKPPESQLAVRPDLREPAPTQPSFTERVGAGQAARVTTERPSPSPAQAGGVNPNPSADEVRAYITQAAQARGIDPDTALKVAQSEGGFEAARRGTFSTGSSWWPFQLHYGGAGYEHLGNVAGMGNQFTKETGFAPGDPNAWQAATDYALDRAKKGGWGAWYGAKKYGITGYHGIDRSVPDDPSLFQSAVERGKKVAGDVVTGAQQAATGAIGQISQFGDAALSAGEAAAACGPAAAVRFAQRFGRNPTLREAVDLAKTVGWTAQQGMAGIASEHKLMEKLGVPVELVMGRDWNRVTQEAQTGNPVTISTSKHYFTIDDYDPKTGKYHVGSSGTDLRGGSDWMNSAQMEAALGGGVMQGALIADNPAVASQSIAGADTNPLDWLGRQKDSLVQQLGGAKEAVEEKVTEVRRGLEEPVSTLGTRAQDLGDIVVRQLDQAIDRVAEVTEPLTTGLGEQQRVADELRQQAEQERLGLQGRPYNPLEQVGESVIQSSDQMSRAPGQLYGADVAAGQVLSNQVVDAAKAAGWDPDPGQERFVRNTVAQVTPSNVLISALTAGQGSLLRVIAQGTAELAGGAIGSELARTKAEEAGWPEWAQGAAQMAGGIGGGITGALGSRGAIRAAESPLGQAAIRSRLPAEAETGFALGAPTRGLAERTPGPGTALAPDASDAIRSAAEDADKIRIMRERVIRGEVPVDPTPDEVRQVLNGLSAAAEKVTDRRARLKSLEDHLERLQGEPLSPEQKAWMASRNYEGHQDAALAVMERLTQADLSAVPKNRRVDLEVFLEQMDNADKALATERTVAAEVGARPLRPVAGTAAADRAEIALRNAERDLGRLEKLEAEGRGPGMAAMQAAEAKVARLQSNLEDLTSRTAERQTGRIETEALEEMGREPLRLSLRDAELRFRDAERAYATALDKEDLAARGMGPLPDPVRVRAAERELDRAEWQLLKAEESAGAASEARQTRIGERAEADIAGIEERGPVETPALARASRDVQYAERDLARAQRNVEARSADAQQKVVSQAQSRLDRAMEHLQAETAAAEAARAERAAAAGQAAFGARKFSGGATAQAHDAIREMWRQRLGDEDFALVEKGAEAAWASSRYWRDRLAKAGVIGETQRQFLEDNFPHYIHTDILDDMSQEAIDSLPSGGKSFSVGSNGIQRLTTQGTERARMNPTSSMVDMGTRAEGLAQRNEIMRTIARWPDAHPGMGEFIKPLKAGERPPKGYVTMSYMDGENGKQSIAVAEGLEGTLDLSKPNAGILGMFLSGASLPLRAGATALRPAFIAVNGTNDLLWSLYRFAVDAPPPVEGAKARRDLAKGLAIVFGDRPAQLGGRAEALQDLITGYKAQLPRRLGGDPELVQRAREAGGTVGGPRTRYENPDAIARELMGDHVWVRPIRTQKDVTTVLKDSWGAATDVAGMFWSRPLGVVGRPVEEAPRLGAFARAERLGLSPEEAAFAKRTQTADFDAGGTWTKMMNNLLPFANATTQATAEFGAVTRKNPRATAVAQGVIISTIVASEIYNRAISQEDHRNMSRHLRDHGLGLLDPRAPEGEGKRGVAFVPLRGGIGLLVPLIREVMSRHYGDNPRTWERLALEVFGTLSPVEPELGGAASFAPPPVKTAMELNANYDYFRDQPIVPESLQGAPPSYQYNERTSQAARHLSASGLPFVSQKPPMAIDYAIRAISPGPGEAALGMADEIITRTGNALPERPAKGVPGARDIPLVGGIAGRFLRTTGEELRSEAYDTAAEIMEINRQKIINDVENSEAFKAETPDMQLKMMRALELELEEQAQDIAGVEPKDRDLGLPDKYLGVTDPKLTRDIDEALSKYRAWDQDPKNNARPTGDELKLALRYEDLISPRYQMEAKKDAEQMAQIRRQVQEALAAEREKRAKK